jgi:RNA polymerase sigma-70 factor, ECF subfamily
VSTRPRGVAPKPPGDDAYDAVFRTHKAEVVRICRWHLGDPAEAEDVAQEVFIRLARRWDDDRRPTAMRAWLARVAVRLARRRRRQLASWRASDPAVHDVAELPGAIATPEDAAIRHEVQRLVVDAFQALPHRQRQVYLLRDVAGWSTHRVAEVLALGAGTVKHHLYRARRALRRRLDARR